MNESMTRRQASLYLAQATAIEDLRHRFNPVQAQLIPAHVTLCREDEVGNWDSFAERIKELLPLEITLGFGAPCRNGNLVYLPAVSGLDHFDSVRHQTAAWRNANDQKADATYYDHSSSKRDLHGGCVRRD